jgi:hypothetical protein
MSNLEETPVECNKPNCNCQKVKALFKIKEENQDDFVIFNALKTCRNIFKNILIKPNEEKFRTLKTSNEKLFELVIKPSGSVSLLKAAGFEKKGDDELVMKKIDFTSLKKTVELVEAFMFREYGNVNEKSNEKELKNARLEVASERKKKEEKKRLEKEERDKIMEKFKMNRENVNNDDSRPKESKAKALSDKAGNNTVNKFKNEDLFQGGG